uniref:hypothetical protein n=1 Tax=Cellvibrio fontiphilus TaxID=1815559 RepID=UPI002B4C1CED|nr:hypothetical protein [Cellvibrio fontiphilus]
MECIAVLQQLDRDLVAIEMIRNGLSAQENNIKSISLFDSNTGQPISKVDFKELASAGNIINQVSAEALISLVANSIETFSIRLKRHLGAVWEPFTSPRDDIKYGERARQFRALNNIFKHQEGYIDPTTSRAAKFLVQNGYFKEKTYLKHLNSESIISNIELAIYEVFAHMYDICYQLGNLEKSATSMSGSELVQSLKENVVYEIIQPHLSQSAS